MAHMLALSDANIKANELLHRRLTVEDAADGHVAALERAGEIGFGLYILSAHTPFRPEDCDALIADAPSVVARYFPSYPELYARRGWTMSPSIDRVYCAAKAERELGFRCATGFAEVLAALAREGDPSPER
jgi:UDP-glucose 4-epimerase